MQNKECIWDSNNKDFRSGKNRQGIKSGKKNLKEEVKQETMKEGKNSWSGRKRRRWQWKGREEKAMNWLKRVCDTRYTLSFFSFPFNTLAGGEEMTMTQVDNNMTENICITPAGQQQEKGRDITFNLFLYSCDWPFTLLFHSFSFTLFWSEYLCVFSFLFLPTSWAAYYILFFLRHQLKLQSSSSRLFVPVTGQWLPYNP